MVTQEYNRGSIQIFFLASSDTKPTEDVSNGSVIIEVDTGKQFRFDIENVTWHDFGYAKVVF